VFVGFGNAKLANKIVSCTTDQKVFAIKILYSSGGSCVAVERQRRREFPVRVASPRDTVSRTVKHLKKQKREKGSKRSPSVHA
jgi:hypothetical protein